MQKLARTEGIDIVVMHMCQYGMMSKQRDGSYKQVFTPTRWMSNSMAVLSMLSCKCSHGHEHVRLVGGKAALSLGLVWEKG